MGWFAHFGIVSKFQKKNLVCKFFGQKRMLLQKKYYIAYSAQLGLSLAKSVSSETFFGPQKLRHPKIVSNSWDIAEMDKYYQDICCLDKCQLASIKDCPRSLPLDFGLNVLAEIFLIWTNVFGKNVSWTTVTMTVAICSICCQELTRYLNNINI